MPGNYDVKKTKITHHECPETIDDGVSGFVGSPAKNNVAVIRLLAGDVQIGLSLHRWAEQCK